MNFRFSWVGAMALTAILGSEAALNAATPGVILITTRKAQDLTYATTDALDMKGPGQASQGDVAMAALLGDNGYSSRIVMDQQITENADPYLAPASADFNPLLVIVSGSSGSADVPGTLNLNIPVMMGEHSCLGNRTFANNSSIQMYTYTVGSGSGNLVNPAAGQYMKVTAAGKTHPILAGLPLDDQDQIKIFRDAYPEENLFVPPTGKPNYEYSWTVVHDYVNNITNTDTQVLGALGSDPTKAVFAVNDIGGFLASGETNKVRLVHWLVNEDGSGGSRRMFNALTDAGRTIFVRTVKWALGDTLQPVTPIRIKDITPAGGTALNIRWDALAVKNYKILAATDVAAPEWQTIVEDIHGLDGEITRKLDISAGPQAVFMKIRATP